MIRSHKLYHAQVYDFAFHPAKLAFLRDGSLDEKRAATAASTARFATLANFLESVPTACPHDLFRREDGTRGSQLDPHSSMTAPASSFSNGRTRRPDGCAHSPLGRHQLRAPPEAPTLHARQRFQRRSRSKYRSGSTPKTSPPSSGAGTSSSSRKQRPPRRRVRRAQSPAISTSCKSATAQFTSSTTNPTRPPGSRSPSSPSMRSRSRT